jgi:hypothetical protein
MVRYRPRIITLQQIFQTKVLQASRDANNSGRSSKSSSEELNPKQGEQAIASEKVEQDISQFEKDSSGEKKGSGNALEGLPSNADRKSGV